MIKDPKELKDFVVKILEEKKAQDIKPLKLDDDSTLCDYMIFASGRSSTNVKAIAEAIAYELKHTADRNFSLEGKGSQWMLIDIGDIIVHVFHPDAREHFKIDDHWEKKSNR